MASAVTGATLNYVKNVFNSVSLQHKDIKQFYFGTSYDVAVSPQTQYPIVFLETPYNVNYNDNGRLKTYSFALLVLFKTVQDDLQISHDLISHAEDIGDAILSKIKQDYGTKLILSGIRALSLDSFSDDYLAGVRYELTVTVNRVYAVPACLDEQFEAGC